MQELAKVIDLEGDRSILSDIDNHHQLRIISTPIYTNVYIYYMVCSSACAWNVMRVYVYSSTDYHVYTVWPILSSYPVYRAWTILSTLSAVYLIYIYPVNSFIYPVISFNSICTLLKWFCYGNILKCYGSIFDLFLG